MDTFCKVLPRNALNKTIFGKKSIFVKYYTGQRPTTGHRFILDDSLWLLQVLGGTSLELGGLQEK